MASDRLPNPYKGQPGWWNRLNQLLFPFMGPAQVGTGGVARTDPVRAPASCRDCGHPYSEHEIRRGIGANQPSSILCPSEERREPGSTRTSA